MADFFISHTDADRPEAEWVATTLTKAGFVVRLAAWEVGAGDDFVAWMQAALEECDRVLAICSEDYLAAKARFSAAERNAVFAQSTESAGAALALVLVKECRLPRLFAPLRRVDLSGLDEVTARDRLLEYLAPARRPTVTPTTAPLAELRQSIARSPKLSSLPALFETDRALPLARAYVELRLSPRRPAERAPLQLEGHLALAEKLHRRALARRAVRRSPPDLLDIDGLRSALILGPPGAGKSSLLRRLALDVASGRWRNFDLPLFVEARGYWRARCQRPGLSLARFAIEQVTADADAAARIEGTLRASDCPARTVLLVDGLDEIAADPEAVDVVYDALTANTRWPWIATSRPAGLMRSLEEERRFELAELDDEGIEALIDNWSAALPDGGGTPADSDLLKAEVFGKASLRDMAGNPFLLTALCFLKSSSPHDPLPPSRVAIYESLLSRIALQAQRRHANPKILSAGTLHQLEEFSYYLYERSSAVQQIFTTANWHEFVEARGIAEPADFDADVLPARLLAAWGEDDPHYHFIHLTLQEYLIARAMLSRSVELALERRFAPGWRAGFRFYGALLWQTGRHDEFRKLTSRLYEERDLSRIHHLCLGEIFADAGIRSTEEWIGEDLRTDLLMAMYAGYREVPQALANVLTALDPDWFEGRLMDDVDRLDNVLIALADEGAPYPGAAFVEFGQRDSSPYTRLAQIPTKSARRTISEAFWGHDLPRALVAAHGFAQVATPAQRRKLYEAAALSKPFDDVAHRAFAFALSSRRIELLPFMERVMHYAADDPGGLFQEALTWIADVGGPDAFATIERRLAYEVEHLSEHGSGFDVVVSALVQYGGDRACQTLRRLAAQPELEDWRDNLLTLQIEAGAGDDQTVIEGLEDSSAPDEVLSALVGAASRGRLPTAAVVRSLRRIVGQLPLFAVEQLAELEGARIEGGEPPALCEGLLDWASELRRAVQDPEQPALPSFLNERLRLIVEVLGEARFPAARPLIRELVDDPQTDPDVRDAAICAAGQLWRGTQDAGWIERLRDFIFQSDSPHTAAAAVAIGRIDLEALFRLKSADCIPESIERLASWEDLLVFEDHWVDRTGRITKWRAPPTRILCVFDDECSEVASHLGHELSKLGFCIEVSTDRCVAAVALIPVHGPFAVKMLAEARRRVEDEPHFELFEASADMTEAEVEATGRDIGLAIQRRLKSNSG